jgi:transcriptional regulator with GAF, ATPase, and Fis domain
MINYPQKAIDLLQASLFTRRGLLILAGIGAFLYAVIVLLYVQSIPDIGLRSAFSPKIRGLPRAVDGVLPGNRVLQEGDEVVKVGDIAIETWADLLNAPFHLRHRLDETNQLPSWAKKAQGDQAIAVRVQFKSPGDDTIAESWCVLGNLPWEDLIPSILWFLLEVTLFSVGALVLWKRPTDKAAAQFFLLCVVSLGAFMGGYHWSHIATQPVLLLIFMVCAVLFPVVSLHFYLLFPRRNRWLETRPRLTLAAIYAPPVAFLITLMVLYFRLRWLVQGRAAMGTDAESLGLIDAAFDLLRHVIYAYLCVAALWYLACVVSLLHSFRTVNNVAERNQVKWILYGAVLAILPVGYSLYLAIWDPDAFGAGRATWPMFGASACLTTAFAISITRYRLMELDKIISSGMGYFLISFLAGLAYYGVVLIGALVFSKFITSPKLSAVLTVSTTALVLMLVLDLARTRFKRALDRRFFRDKSQLDRMLQRLSKAVQQLVDPGALANKLLQIATEQLSVPRGAVYLRQGEPPIYRLASWVGPAPELGELAPGFPLIEAVQEGIFVGTRSRESGGLTPAQRQLQFLGGEIAHPLVHEGRLLALLILGHKETTYRTEDVDLLAAFAQITVLALESAEGHRTIEQLNRELQTKLEKISEQQRRILTLETRLRRQSVPSEEPVAPQASLHAVASGGIVGSGPVVQQLLHLVRKVAAADTVVLIRGESGTGKELLAKAVHETSGRADKAFIKVHCAALSANLLESELFGHVKGAFTGAHKDKVGRFEAANGGTLFLDEIGDISLEVQTKLLRVLQEKTIERVGSSESMAVDVRILAATHQDLEGLIRRGRFREDLFYRLNVFPIRMPPLREHVEDIPELAMHFVRLSAHRNHKEVTHIDDEVLVAFKEYSWPGNIRQLENVIERAVVLSDGQALTMHEFAPENFPFVPLREELEPSLLVMQEAAFASKPEPGNWRNERDRIEREQMVRALAAASGNKAEAARALGIARSTLVSKLKKLGLS